MSLCFVCCPTAIQLKKPTLAFFRLFFSLRGIIYIKAVTLPEQRTRQYSVVQYSDRFFVPPTGEEEEATSWWDFLIKETLISLSYREQVI